MRNAQTILYDLSKVPAKTRNMILRTPKLRKLFTKKVTQMLRLDGSTKVIKGNKKGFRTAILYLAPADLSGENMCAMAVLAGCDDPCLNLSGRGVMTINQVSRLRKTLFWLQYRDDAIALIKREIAVLEARAKREGYTLLVRLNGTSDVRWERHGVIQSFPNVQFYDYTKLPNRKNVPANYDLTFSYSGKPGFLPYVEIAKRNGMRIAAVFRSREIVEKLVKNGSSFFGLPVVDGDDTDIRHIDPQGSLVALYAKGVKAKADQSGFIVH